MCILDFSRLKLKGRQRNKGFFINNKAKYVGNK